MRSRRYQQRQAQGCNADVGRGIQVPIEHAHGVVYDSYRKFFTGVVTGRRSRGGPKKGWPARDDPHARTAARGLRVGNQFGRGESPSGGFAAATERGRSRRGSSETPSEEIWTS